MSNAWEHPTWVAKETMMQLENTMVMGNLVHRGFEPEFIKTQNGWEIGDTITIKTPVYSRTVAGPDITGLAVDFYEQKTTFQVNTWRSVPKKLSALEYTFDMKAFSSRLIKPAILALVDYIDQDLANSGYKRMPNQVGTPGTQLKNFLTIGQAGARLTNLSVPLSDRHCLLDPDTQAYIANEMKGLFHPQMVGSAFQKAKLPPIAGFDTYVSQNVPTHTPGSWAGSSDVLIDDTVAEEDTDFNLDQNGAGAALTLKEGDVFTVANVKAVNKVNGNTLPFNRPFVVTADTVFANVGGGDYNITPAIIPGTAPYNLRSSGAAAAKLPYQNLSALPVENAAVTIPGTASTPYRVAMAFHTNCISLAMVPIAIPPSITWKQSISKNGFSLVWMRGTDIYTLQEVLRCDVLYDIIVVNPDLGCRIASA